MRVDSKRDLFACVEAGKLVVRRLSTGKVLHEIKPHFAFAHAFRKTMTISDDGEYLACCACFDFEREAYGVEIFSLESGKVVKQLTGHNAIVSDVKFFADAKRFASVDLNGKINIWSLETGGFRR